MMKVSEAVVFITGANRSLGLKIQIHILMTHLHSVYKFWDP